MKKIAIWQMLATVVLALGIQSAAFAHTHMSMSSPQNDETVSSPSVMMLTFGDAVRLVRVSVTGANGELDIGFTPVADAQASFHMPMPFMAAGAYVVNWTAIGADGHSASDKFGFTVDPNAPAAVMNHGDMEMEDHGHDAAHSHDDSHSSDAHSH
jgi:methionine-rich copper-binding protein CopC